MLRVVGPPTQNQILNLLIDDAHEALNAQQVDGNVRPTP